MSYQPRTMDFPCAVIKIAFYKWPNTFKSKLIITDSENFVDNSFFKICMFATDIQAALSLDTRVKYKSLINKPIRNAVSVATTQLRKDQYVLYLLVLVVFFACLIVACVWSFVFLGSFSLLFLNCSSDPLFYIRGLCRRVAVFHHR